jgi:F-type H+-transporting ATPase subunit b
MKLIILIVLFFMLSAQSVFSAEGVAHGGGDLKDWAFKTINFAILVFILVKFLGKPIKNYVVKRKELIEKSIKESQEAKEVAQRALQEVEEKLKLKDKEIQDIIDSAKKIGQQEKQQIIQETDKMKDKILEQAKSNIEFELKMAKEALRREAADLTIQLSEQKLKERITPEEHEKLFQESIKIIEERRN